MKEQKRKSWCGPASIQNALRSLGRNVSQRRVARLCGTNRQGTDDDDFIQGLDALGVSYDQFGSNSGRAARTWLRRNVIRSGYPVILCTDHWEHWVCCFGHLGTVMHVFDPSRWKKNKREHHVQHYEFDEMMVRWEAREERRKSWAEGEPYFGGFAIIDKGDRR